MNENIIATNDNKTITGWTT